MYSIEEMRKALEFHCENVDGCGSCLSVPDKDGNCFSCDDEDVVRANFERVFGKCCAADNVNHPAHYETGKFECIDVMIETQGVEAVKAFCVCNAFKYIYRHNNKNGVEDVKKALWYLNKYVELEDAKP